MTTMRVHCYLGWVEPATLYNDLVRGSPWAASDAAMTVDIAIEDEIARRRALAIQAREARRLSRLAELAPEVTP